MLVRMAPVVTTECRGRWHCRRRTHDWLRTPVVSTVHNCRNHNEHLHYHKDKNHNSYCENCEQKFVVFHSFTSLGLFLFYTYKTDKEDKQLMKNR